MRGTCGVQCIALCAAHKVHSAVFSPTFKRADVYAWACVIVSARSNVFVVHTAFARMCAFCV